MEMSFQNAIVKKKKRKRQKTKERGSHALDKRLASDRTRSACTFDTFMSSTPNSLTSTGSWCDDVDMDLGFNFNHDSSSTSLDNEFSPTMLDVAELAAFDATTQQASFPSSLSLPSLPSLPSLLSLLSLPTGLGTPTVPETSTHAAIRLIVSQHVTALDLPKQASIPLDAISRTLLNFKRELRRQSNYAQETTTSLRSEITTAVTTAVAAVTATVAAKREVGRASDMTKVNDMVHEKVAVQVLKHSKKTDNDIMQLQHIVSSAQRTIATLSAEVRRLKSARPVLYLSEPSSDDIQQSAFGEEEEKEEAYGARSGTTTTTTTIVTTSSATTTTGSDERVEPTPTSVSTPSFAPNPGPLLVARFAKWARSSRSIALQFLVMCGSLEDAMQAYFFCPTFTYASRRMDKLQPWLFYNKKVRQDICGQLSQPGQTYAPLSQTICRFCGSRYTGGRVRVLGYIKRDKVVGRLCKFPNDDGVWNTFSNQKWFCTSCWSHAASERERTAHCPADGFVRSSVTKDLVFQRLCTIDFDTAEVELLTNNAIA
jgi:hypothetical protein